MDDLPDLEISMIRNTLDDLPDYSLPPGFTLRPYQPGDENAWVAIHLVADQFNIVTPELFVDQFGNDATLLRQRQFYLLDPQGQAIGTSSAWFNDDYHGTAWGRVHWVAITPSMQGRGLAKPLLAATCQRLRDLGHARAYLTTSGGRLPAIGLYLKFGFVPEILTPEDASIWADVLKRLGKSADFRSMQDEQN